MWKKQWIMTQQWEHVLFLHWPVQPHEIGQYIPKELELDLYENRAWMSLVLFEVTENRLRLMPCLPALPAFLQLNVRTYVTYKGRRGVHFFSLDVSNALVVRMKTMGHFLPYRLANMSLKKMDNLLSFTSSHESSTTCKEALAVTFEPAPSKIECSSFDSWLVERYHLWTKVNKYLFRVDICHSPWRLQPVNVFIDHHTMAPFWRNATQQQPIAHYAKSKKARIFLPVVETKIPDH